MNFHHNLSFADNNKIPDWKPLLKTVYQPYIPYACKYSTLERQLLDTYLWDCFSKVDSQTDLPDYIRHVELTIPAILRIAKEAESRCIQFTRGCGLDGLILALKVGNFRIRVPQWVNALHRNDSVYFRVIFWNTSTNIRVFANSSRRRLTTKNIGPSSLRVYHSNK